MVWYYGNYVREMWKMSYVKTKQQQKLRSRKITNWRQGFIWPLTSVPWEFCLKIQHHFHVIPFKGFNKNTNSLMYNGCSKVNVDSYQAVQMNNISNCCIALWNIYKKQHQNEIFYWLNNFAFKRSAYLVCSHIV